MVEDLNTYEAAESLLDISGLEKHAVNMATAVKLFEAIVYREIYISWMFRNCAKGISDGYMTLEELVQIAARPNQKMRHEIETSSAICNSLEQRLGTSPV